MTTPLLEYCQACDHNHITDKPFPDDTDVAEHSGVTVWCQSYAAGVAERAGRDLREMSKPKVAERASRAEGKPRWSLLPFDALNVLAAHYTRGAAKYADRNWELGAPWSEQVDSLLRHLAAWQQGEDLDPEGFDHLVAVVWNALALLTYRTRNIGTDDRPTQVAQPTLEIFQKTHPPKDLAYGHRFDQQNVDVCSDCGYTGAEFEAAVAQYGEPKRCPGVVQPWEHQWIWEANVPVYCGKCDITYGAWHRALTLQPCPGVVGSENPNSNTV